MSKQVIISMIEVGARELDRTARAVPDDKLQWKPLDNGRTVIDLLGDAAQAPTLCTGLLRGTIQYGPELFQRLTRNAPVGAGTMPSLTWRRTLRS